MSTVRSLLAGTALAGTLAAISAVAPYAAAGIAAADAPSANDTAATADAASQATLSELEVTPWIAQSQWYPKYKDDSRVEFLQATSPAMGGRKIPLAVIPAQNPNRPTVYLLNGAGSGEQNTDWLTHSSVVDFYSDKDVNVVIPMSGAFSYYIDWQEDPNGAGKYLRGPQKWETFLTKELPGPFEQKYNANGKRAIAGMSMSATSSLLMAEHNPGFYDAVGSYSGCAATSNPLAYEAAAVVVGVNGGVPQTLQPDEDNTRRMFGAQGSPSNVHNDALVNAEKLRGTETYISSSPGLLGEKDLPGYVAHQEGVNDKTASAQSWGVYALQGMPIEGVVNKCTHDMKAKTDSLGVPVTYNFRDVGIHNWNGWEDDMIQSWNVFERAFNS